MISFYRVQINGDEYFGRDKRCTVCERDFPYDAWGRCPGVKQYEWGKANDGIHTARQLDEMGLVPGEIIGALYCSKFSIVRYALM